MGKQRIVLLAAVLLLSASATAAGGIPLPTDEFGPVIGDVDRSGKVNATDRIVLARYLGKWDGYDESRVDLTAADVNGDGSVNAKDRIILSRYVAKWDGYETLPHK